METLYEPFINHELTMAMGLVCSSHNVTCIYFMRAIPPKKKKKYVFVKVHWVHPLFKDGCKRAPGFPFVFTGTMFA